VRPGLTDTEFHALAGRDLAEVSFPVMRPDEVAGAALARLGLGEVVCVPGLPDPSMVGAVSQAQRALLMTAASSRLADRYRLGPENERGTEDMLRSTTEAAAVAKPAASDIYALGRDLAKGGAVMANQRTVSLVDGFVDRVREFIRDERVTYAEYHAALRYLIRAAEAGEIPLLVAVFAESTVNTVNQDGGRATDSAIEGPYYKPGAPWLQRPYALPMRPDEPGDPLLFCGRVESDGGAPLAGAAVDLWQSTSDGLYSFFTPQLPEEYVLRGRLRAGAAGEFDVRTIRPVPYQIPREGPVGDLLENILGRHSWRPAHLHFKIGADGYQPLTTQLYFAGDPYLDSDCGSAVKDSLVIELTRDDADGASYRGEYVFRLAPA
jgi:catechol 1,2-dioxygenase